MGKRWLRLFVSMAALTIALVAFSSSEARATAGSCRNVAPFCANICSCGPMRCSADCEDECSFPDGGDGAYTVWCEDIM